MLLLNILPTNVKWRPYKHIKKTHNPVTEVKILKSIATKKEKKKKDKKKKIIPGLNGFITKFYLAFREELIPIHLKLFLY